MQGPGAIGQFAKLFPSGLNVYITFSMHIPYFNNSEGSGEFFPGKILKARVPRIQFLHSGRIFNCGFYAYFTLV